MAALPPSEFGGSDTSTRHGIQPPPHSLTSSERLRMVYQTGDELGDPGYVDREGAAMQGLLPVAEQTRIVREMGLLDKGQVWDEMQQAAEAAGGTIQTPGGG